MIGGGYIHVPGHGIINDTLDQGLRLAAQSAARGIEGLGEQLLVTGKQEIAIGVNGVRLSLEQGLIFTAIHRRIVDRVVSGKRGSVVNGEVEEVFAVGKEEGPAMGGVLRAIDVSNGGDRAAVGANTIDPVYTCGRENDHAVGSPSAAASDRRIGDDLRRAARDIYNFQFSLGKEPKRAVVERPERKDGVVGPGELVRLEGVSGAHPYCFVAIGAGCGESDGAAIR